MKNERIWSYVKETTSHLQNKLTKNINLWVATSTHGCCPKFERGDNSTYTLTKGGGEGMYLVSATPTKLIIEFL
jgi:hypothetical protein